MNWLIFNTKGLEIPDEAQVLHKDIRSIGKGFGVIPDVVKKRAMEHMIRVDEYQAKEIFMGIFASTETSAPNEGLKGDEVFDEVVNIQMAAMDSRNEDVAEPEWNSAVHYSLIKLALKGFWSSKGIWFHDISIARVSDSSLLLGITSKAKKVQSKMVDYAMVIRPAQDLLYRIKDLLREIDGFSINHTDARYVRFKPIGLSIETKRGGIDQDKANTQLGTWVSAHFAKLSQLIRGNGNLPLLPLIIIQGNKWEFMIAHKVNVR